MTKATSKGLLQQQKLPHYQYPLLSSVSLSVMVVDFRLSRFGFAVSSGMFTRQEFLVVLLSHIVRSLTSGLYEGDRLQFNFIFILSYSYMLSLCTVL